MANRSVREGTAILNNLRTSIFWIKEDYPTHLCMNHDIGIHRVMWRGSEDKQIVIFKCLTTAKTWLDNIAQGYLEVRWSEYGMLDNPWTGERVCTIKNISISDAWINKLSLIEYDVKHIMFYFMAKCDIEWDLFNIEVGNGQSE